MGRFDQAMRRLERLADERLGPPPLTEAEKLRRFNELLAYAGNDHATLARQARARDFLRRFRERIARERGPA